MEDAVRERVTRSLETGGLGKGGTRAADELLPLVYDELRSLARAYLRRESSGHTLQPTAVVHEAYMRLVDHDRIDWQGRTHFFAVGASTMRRVLIDHARSNKRQKRGGDWHRVTLGGAEELTSEPLGRETLLAIDQAIERLAAESEREAKVVEMRFFGGLNMEDIALHLGVSKRTVESDWTHARAWLRRELAQGRAPAS